MSIFMSDIDLSSTPSYKEQAYHLIKNAILFDKLKPNEIYSQDNICKELGISRTPVREALLELQKDGYIVFCRGRGIKVASISEQEAYEILESRLHTECLNAFLAAKRATKEQISAMQKALLDLQHHSNSESSQKLYVLDHYFHKMIALATDNRIMYDQTEKLLDCYLRFEVKYVYENPSDSTIVYNEHFHIFDSIRNKNAEMSKQYMHDHLINSYKRTCGKYWTLECQERLLISKQ